MRTEKIISGRESGKTLKECIDLMHGVVYQYKSAGQSIYNTGVYIRGRSYNPIEGLPMHRDIYILTCDGISLLCYNTNPHRATSALKLYKNGMLENVDNGVWSNYITNGYITRRGLLANYTNDLDRINMIARSHADYIGLETGKSSADHKNRVKMRKNNFNKGD